MNPAIVLDSTPLGLLTQRSGVKAADDCRAWLLKHTNAGSKIVIPAIIDYELRRELLRAGKTASVRRLDSLIAAPSVQFLDLTVPTLKLAAQLWADVRRRGFATAGSHSLDIDVILAAQVLEAGFQPVEFIVATANVGHLQKLVPAATWESI